MPENADTPATLVYLGGVARDLGVLSSARIQQRLSMPDLCELHYRYPSISDDENLVGLHLRLEVQSDRQLQTLFDGEITAVEYRYLPTSAGYDGASNLEIVVRAYNILHRLRKHQSVRAFEKTSFRQLAFELGRRHGINKVRVWQNQFLAAWPLIVQHQQTDLEFLVEVAAQAGLYVTLLNDELNAFSLTGGLGGNEVRLERQQMIEARIEINADNVCNRVDAAGWSTSKAVVRRGNAQDRRLDKSIDSGFTNGDEVRQLVNETTPLEGHARNLAQAELDWIKSSELTLWAKVAGSIRLRPGIPVKLNGVAKPISGRFVLTEVDHTITEDGFFSEISSNPPEPIKRARSDVTTVGVVTKTDDPEKLGRMQVNLPAYNDIHTDWIPQVLPAAGPNKGFVCLPEVGDLVLVLLMRENPAQGVVLGGLYGEKKVPDHELLDNDPLKSSRGRHFTWTTAAGQRILLNEQGDLLRLENKAGALIELKESNVLIKGKRVDFEQI